MILLMQSYNAAEDVIKFVQIQQSKLYCFQKPSDLLVSLKSMAAGLAHRAGVVNSNEMRLFRDFARLFIIISPVGCWIWILSACYQIFLAGNFHLGYHTCFGKSRKLKSAPISCALPFSKCYQDVHFLRPALYLLLHQLAVLATDNQIFLGLSYHCQRRKYAFLK